MEMKIGVPDNTHDQEFCELVEQMCQIKFDGTRRYGIQYGELGVKSLFCDLNRKYLRLKHCIWEEAAQMSSENLEDTLFDNAVYSLLTIMKLRETQQQKKRSWPGPEDD